MSKLSSLILSEKHIDCETDPKYYFYVLYLFHYYNHIMSIVCLMSFKANNSLLFWQNSRLIIGDIPCSPFFRCINHLILSGTSPVGLALMHIVCSYRVTRRQRSTAARRRPSAERRTCTSPRRRTTTRTTTRRSSTRYHTPPPDPTPPP